MGTVVHGGEGSRTQVRPLLVRSLAPNYLSYLSFPRPLFRAPSHRPFMIRLGPHDTALRNLVIWPAPPEQPLHALHPTEHLLGST